MSVDIFIQAFENGDPQVLKTKEILACFDGVVSARGDGYIDVKFGPHDSASIYFAVEDDSDTGIMINRPCGHIELARRLYRVMKLGNCALFGAEDGFIVLSEETATHMPEDMRESLGEARVADSEDAFVALYHSL